ncbi:MAG: hypothetical protein NZ528_07265 [Caldilineales bacterium]|nr:hypothetical protein [Caldilineales bacterium]MDW8317315.1 hypothetical protein [Anaerolineae bacterium]
MDLTFQPRFDCSLCPTRCDGRSKAAYVFEEDAALSAGAEAWLMAHLAAALDVEVRQTPARRRGLPDLELVREGRLLARVEVKAQGRAFMAVERLLPQANLRPYETVALNLSDIRRYAALYRAEGVPLFVVWRVKRPCLGEGYWGHHIEALMAVGNRYRDRRKWRRASTPSDVVDGEHRGVTVNYHFSLRELLPLEELLALLPRD